MRLISIWFLLTLSSPLLVGACTSRGEEVSEEVSEPPPGPSLTVVRTGPSKEGPRGSEWVYELDLELYNDSSEDVWYILFLGAPHPLPEPSLRTLELREDGIRASRKREDRRDDSSEPRHGLLLELYADDVMTHASAYHVPAGARLSDIIFGWWLAREGSSAEIWETPSILLPDERELAAVLREKYDADSAYTGYFPGAGSLTFTPSRRRTFRLDPPRHPDGTLKGAPPPS